MGGSGPPSNTWFLRPTQVLNPNGSSIGAAVFAGLTSVTDRTTDRATRSVRIGRIYVRSTAMRPKKIDRRKKPEGKNIMSASATQGGQQVTHNINQEKHETSWHQQHVQTPAKLLT